ncbi:helix-turn-helix transcriptional regulator [Phaeobacter gallaeciensis]|uniref:helix-turn-helix domain-containing protein n=1 Tax=Phaeobacter gallaeciensis TaxID=60890 RepID=UPI0023806E3A|nr:helix-turn-helix transcriptional regulator [Phaeobacter gallaeciensis]MDE4297058.1 helix-turn-helix transcriptional regulator [Phaeobacter gallaeciensis]
MFGEKMSSVDEGLSRIAKLVGDRVEELKGVKSQRDIASEAGYKNQNMITMIKQGTSKVALDRAPKLARALEVDPRQFMLLALEQFYTTQFIDQMLKDLGCAEK